MATTPPLHPRSSTRTLATVDLTTNSNGTSDVLNLTGLTLSSIQMSTAWDAAVLGFQGNVDGSTNYYNFYDANGNLYYHTVGASRMVVFDPAIFAGAQVLRFISETTGGVVVAQTAVRTLKLGLTKQDAG